MKNVLYAGCAAAPDPVYVQLLQDAGYRVRVGTIGQLVTDLRSSRTNADMVIVECTIMSGEIEELVWQLKRAAPDIPFLFLARDITVESYLRSLALGFHEYLCQPVHDSEVLSTVRALTREARMRPLAS